MKTTQSELLKLVLSVLVSIAVISAEAQFNYITNSDNSILITGYTGAGGNVLIPDTINGHPVTGIGGSAFYNLSTPMGVTMPDSVTNIGIAAFFTCTGLTNVVLGNHLSSLATMVFASCTNLMNLTIPESVQNIGDSAFNSCSALKTVVIPNGVTSIGGSAFSGCTDLTNVVVGSGVNTVGGYGFSECFALKQLFFWGDRPSDGPTILSGDSSCTVYYLPGTAGWFTSFSGWSMRPTAQWYQPQPLILGKRYGLGVQPNGFNLTVSWATNTSVVVEASTNLQTWIPMATNALVNGTNVFSDPNWANYLSQFYRARAH